MIMKNIKINILDFCGNNHWHYEIMINDKRFVSGWYQYDLAYEYGKEALAYEPSNIRFQSNLEYYAAKVGDHND